MFSAGRLKGLEPGGKCRVHGSECQMGVDEGAGAWEQRRVHWFIGALVHWRIAMSAKEVKMKLHVLRGRG